MSTAEPSRAELSVAAGARAAERLLLDEVGAAIAARDAVVHAAVARGDAAAVAPLLARPLRIVVSSRTLREHVATALVARTGRAVAAVSVHTHWALALSVLDRAGEAAPRGDALFGVAVRRAAREEAALVRALGDLRDGYGVVEAASRDLVDAGFLPVHADALDELLAAQGESDAIVRARAVVRATARALCALARDGLAPRAAVLRRATEIVASRGDASLPTAQLWIHGLADATGVVADWLAALLGAFGGRAIVDQPPDPFRPGERERAFSEPLLARLGGVARRGDAAVHAPDAEIELARAPGAIAEARGVAQRIRALLDAGVAPESIGLVAREPASHRAAIAAQLARLAIPFAAHGFAAAHDARTGRVAALARLLADADRAPIDVWLGASEHADDASSDLRVGLHVLGLGRLADLAALDLDRALGDATALVLPVRQGAAEEEDRSDDAAPARGPGRVRSRWLARERIERARERAREIVAQLAAWPAVARFDAHRAELATLLEARLAWTRDARDGALAPLLDALDALGAEIPDAQELARDELALVVGRALEAAAERPAGGAGAGVQVLSAMAARGCTFSHLFVIGMNRDAFPRKPELDALLPDALRGAMQSLLPELPIKSRARVEERHLFAELLSASGAVVLTWQFVSDEGRECASSSFVERLRSERPALAVETIVPLERNAGALRRAHEHAVRAAWIGPRSRLAAIRSAALREVRATLSAGIDPGALAATQLAVLDELDPDLSTPAGRARSKQMSLYGGRLGARAIAVEAEPPLYVTTLEGFARCPWQSFLRRDLGLEPVPDALEALPSLSPLLCGTVVHAVLERIVRDAGAPTRMPLAEAEAIGPRIVAWPDAARVAALAREAAEHAAAAEGIRSASFVRALARSVERSLAVARDTDWSEPAGLAVLGAELAGEVAIVDALGRARRIGFRADRVDAAADRLRVTDYKTGKASIAGKKAETRRSELLARIRKGAMLQAVAYLAATEGRAERDVTGRFLFLRADADAALREHAVARADRDLVAAFADTVRTALAARDAGAHPPRLVDGPKDEQPIACRWCEVGAACQEGESGARRRTREWLESAARDGVALAPDERAAVDVLLLGRTADAS